ncbi:hypothetical protein MCOR27_011354 [Pyricularia oryzae]|uniref:J domain-containing protein n=2 Tax=Pyricularia TaxID=48558 RepID=A0ABQ8NTX3_PYRGI|nr:hypothetical protein MCOR01_006276 [Pyricularia oryzae]KAI6302044.1 hypothetical protein MCOR33_002502 [Pyricularia grisea]KAI6258912.1 hypothetical protein MCOR19_004754 [Pyricularia oryzae]KAI6264315.1 hypothetical protein MCOR26_011436 [Pyricularia oryzae]KAI6265560.1 hypothetical protein MCOR27_011354 [Pyricularia oryzae]
MLEPLPPDPYKALDIPADAQFDVIKKRYRELVLKCHPDKCPGADKAAATDRFAAVQNAWEILGDATKRQDYHKLVKQHKLAEELARSTRQAPVPSASRGPSSSGYYGTSTYHSSPQTPYGFSRSGSSKTRFEYESRHASAPSFYEADPRSGPHASREPRRPSSWDEDRSRETDRSARDRDRERERDRERDRGRGSPPNRDREREREERDRERTRGIKRDEDERQRKLRSKEAKREEKERAKENEKAARKEEARIQKAKEEERLRKKAEAKRKEKERVKQERDDEERRAGRKQKMEMEAEINIPLREKMKKAPVEDEGRSKKTTVTEDIRSFSEDFPKSEREHERHSERSRDRDSGRTKEQRRSSRSESKRQSSHPRRTTYFEDAPPTSSRSLEDSALTKTQNLPPKSKTQLEAALYRISANGGLPTQSRPHVSYADHEIHDSADYNHRAPKLHRSATDHITGDFGSRPPKLSRSATEKVSSPRRSYEPDYDGYGGTSPSRYYDIQGTPFGRAKFGNVDTRNPTTSSWGGHVATSQWETPPEYSSYIPESRPARYRTAAASYDY